jgi:excinuclease UvrABC helicase subunit UvrB
MAAPFEVISKFQPAGNQPQAIDKLVSGFRQGQNRQVLMGVTGSGILSQCTLSHLREAREHRRPIDIIVGPPRGMRRLDLAMPCLQ